MSFTKGIRSESHCSCPYQCYSNTWLLASETALTANTVHNTSQPCLFYGLAFEVKWTQRNQALGLCQAPLRNWGKLRAELFTLRSALGCTWSVEAILLGNISPATF